LPAQPDGRHPGTAGPWPLPRSREACALARRAVRHTLCRWNLDHLADTAELLVSELVANALLHARGPVQLTLVRGPQVCCLVADGSQELPRVRDAAADDEYGRGMSMVELLAGAWGAARTPWGKEVWFELPARCDGDRD
ncbi:ATP-binding protein, partial [Streptomyces sp. Ru87]